MWRMNCVWGVGWQEEQWRGGLEATAVVQSGDDSGLNKCANSGDVVSCPITSQGLASQGLGVHCLWHNEMSCLSLQPFYSEAPRCTIPCSNYSLYVSSSIGLSSVRLDSFSHDLSGMDLFVGLVGWSCLVPKTPCKKSPIKKYENLSLFF